MTVETFGVDATFVASRWPQVEVNANGPITSTRLTELIEGAAAELIAVLTAAFGVGIESAIASDADSIAYRNCQRLVATFLSPRLLRAAHHMVEGEVSDLEEMADKALSRLRRDPVASTGYVPGAGTVYSPSVVTSTSGLGLDTDDTSRRGRREFDDAADGRDSGGFVF